MNTKKLYTTSDVAAEAGISRDTLLRWLKDGKIPEPGRDRNGWRAFTKAEMERVVRFAKKYTPSPHKAQRELFNRRTKR
jgi:DNA-binding transcriptional MerR regulator